VTKIARRIDRPPGQNDHCIPKTSATSFLKGGLQIVGIHLHAIEFPLDAREKVSLFVIDVLVVSADVPTTAIEGLGDCRSIC